MIDYVLHVFRDADCPFALVSAGHVEMDSAFWIEFLYIHLPHDISSCINRRDQFFLCDIVGDEDLWTLNNGRCSKNKTFDEKNIEEYCHHLVMCELSRNRKQYCTCITNGNICIELFEKSCSSWNVTHYPNGGLLAPYVYLYYDGVAEHKESINDWSLFHTAWKLDGSIKCRGYLAKFQHKDDGSTIGFYLHNQGLLCRSVINRTEVTDLGYHRFCHNDSRTFVNRSYHFIDVCRNTESCISAYRINDGYYNCFLDDEQKSNELVAISCANVRRHRFRCSINQTTCFYASSLGDSVSLCDNMYDEYWLDTTISLSQINCNQQSKVGCPIIRQYIEASWTSYLFGNDESQIYYSKSISISSIL